MTDKIGIEVAAKMDASGVTQGVNQIDQAIKGVGKQKIDIGTEKAKKSVDELTKALRVWLNLQGEIRRQAKTTGQLDATYDQFDWSKASGGADLGNKRHAKFLNWAQNYGDGPGQSTGPNQGGKNGSPAGGMAVNVVQSGMRAAGPAGGVAAGALGTAMSNGAGAGMMGLLGGLGALAVGKAVGAVVEHVGAAENQAVQMDKLKRTLGDVNVSFNALQTAVTGGANNLKITYDEAGKLATQFTKLGNVSGEEYKNLGTELATGVGISRSFGLDASEGVQAMGRMRGVGVTSNSDDSKRMGLLIGETIAKSGAFAKSDEVMGAITNFAESQTRVNLGRANVEGYAGHLAGLVGSGIPGMDVQGSAALLDRVNSSISQGGAAGTASQFFSARLGLRMGLSPLQQQVVQEGGAFSSSDSTFHDPKSAMGKWISKNGLSAPHGSKPMLESTMDQIREEYPNAWNRLEAIQRHLKVGHGQAAALDMLEPKNMGELSKVVDLKTMKADGILAASRALSGGKGERQAIADQYRLRTDVKPEDRAAISKAMGTDKEGEALARIVAKYNQEENTGTLARDSKALLGNIADDLAKHLIPAAQASRDALVFIAGKQGYKDPRKLAEEALRAESGEKESKIKAGYKSMRDSAMADVMGGKITAKEYREKNAELDAQEKADLNREYVGLYNKLHPKAPGTDPAGATDKVVPNDGAKDADVGGRSGAAGGRNSADFIKQHMADAVDAGKEYGLNPAYLLGQMGHETGWGKSVIPGTNNLGNIKDFSGGGVGATDNMTGSRDRYRAYGSTRDGIFAQAKLLRDSFPGTVGARTPEEFGVALGRGRNGAYAEDPNYASKVANAARMAGTPLPTTASGASMGPMQPQSVQVDVTHNFELAGDLGRYLKQPSQTPPTRVTAAVPSGNRIGQ